MRRYTRAMLTLAVATLFLAGSASAQYTFTKIADSRDFTGPFLPDFMMEQWTINDNGTVAFTHPATGATGKDLSVGNGGLTTQITVPGLFNFDPTFGSSFDLDDNDTASFSSAVGFAPTGQNAVFRSSNGIHFQTLVVSPSDPNGSDSFSTIHVKPDGTLTYLDTQAAITSGIRRFAPYSTSPTIPSGATGVSIMNPYGLAYDVLKISTSPFTSIASLGVNSSGSVAFLDNSNPGVGIIASTDGSGAFTILASDASSGAPIAGAGYQPFNDFGQTVYTRQIMDPNTALFTNEIVVTDGTISNVVADDSGAFDFSFTSPTPALNSLAGVAFFGQVTDPNSPSFDGIFTGPDEVNDLVIKTSAFIGGDQVSFLSFRNRGLNDQGQIVFAANMMDPNVVPYTAIFRADPIVPPGVLGGQIAVPGPAAGMGGSLIAMAFISRRRRR